MRTLALWRGGCSCLKYPCGKVWEKGLMKWQHGNPFHGGPRCFYWPFPVSGGKIQCSISWPSIRPASTTGFWSGTTSRPTLAITT